MPFLVVNFNHIQLGCRLYQNCVDYNSFRFSEFFSCALSVPGFPLFLNFPPICLLPHFIVCTSMRSKTQPHHFWVLKNALFHFFDAAYLCVTAPKMNAMFNSVIFLSKWMIKHVTQDHKNPKLQGVFSSGSNLKQIIIIFITHLVLSTHLASGNL